jgi:hypothetical protein
LERLRLNEKQLDCLAELLVQCPRAYQYTLQDADHKQKWALLKKSNFEKCGDFLQIAERDSMKHALLLEYLQSLLWQIKPTDNNTLQLSDPVLSETPDSVVVPGKRREREASLYNYLKLNEALSPATASA